VEKRSTSKFKIEKKMQMKNGKSVNKSDYGKFEVVANLKKVIAIIWRTIFEKFHSQF